MARYDSKATRSFGTLFLLVLTVFSHSAYAVPQLTIASVAVDFVGETLYIYGNHFDNGDPPAVALAGYPLMVTSSSSGEIIAVFPDGGVDPGDYLLTVSTGRSTTRNDSYDLTVGAVGPAGPEGPTGPEGPPGAIDLSRIYVSQCSPPFATCFCQCEEEGEIALSASVSCDRELSKGAIMYMVRDQGSNPMRAWVSLCADTDDEIGEYWCPLDFTVTCLRP